MDILTDIKEALLASKQTQLQPRAPEIDVSYPALQKDMAKSKFTMLAKSVSLNETEYGFEHKHANAWLVVEQGTGNVVIYPFNTQQTCIAAGKKLWWNWVAFDDQVW